MIRTPTMVARPWWRQATGWMRSALGATLALTSGGTLAALDVGDIRGRAFNLRVDISSALMDEDVVSGAESDSNMCIEVGWQYRQAFTPGGKLKPLCAMALAVTSQEADMRTYDISYLAVTARYYLGLSYDFNRNIRIQAAPFLGLGGAWLDISHPDMAENDGSSICGEYGATAHAVFTLGSIDVGAGFGVVGRESRHNFKYVGQRMSIKAEQFYPTGNLFLAWNF